MRTILITWVIALATQVSFAQENNKCSKATCLEQKNQLDLRNYCESNFSEEFKREATDYGVYLYLNNQPVCWCSCKSDVQQNFKLK